MYGKPCSLIGALHLHPLPGAAGYCGSVKEIIALALSDARIYRDKGFDALVVENTHDAPYLKGSVYPETVAAMAVVTEAIRDEIELPIGIQILAGANLEALGVAHALELDFIRVEGFVFAHVGDEGIHEACAPSLIRKRHDLKAGAVKIFADIKKKHASHSITSDIGIAETAKAALMFQADGVVVTGIRTGSAPMPDEVKEARDAVTEPVLVGSGVTPENLPSFYSCSDALIVGSFAKYDGQWQNAVDPDRCQRLVLAMSEASRPT